MRSETEMFRMILDTAESDERIRAVLLNGSRACRDCPADRYQDYDIVYFVTEVKPFYDRCDWIEQRFGEPAVMQCPELMKHPLLPPENNGRFVYLMLFSDGIRIDLTVMPAAPYVCAEPSVVLLDKDGIISGASDDSSCYYVKEPTEAEFLSACNEFWWCLNNVAKGIVRDELPYARQMLDRPVRDMLNCMTDWYIGLLNGYCVSAGKMGKYYKKYLPEKMYKMYCETYCDADCAHIWRAVFTTCGLFRELAVTVASAFGFVYNVREDENMTAYLTAVRDGRL